ncbi:hypothetical protein EDB87DRAFT_1824428 [Lactarius vividus]|nr:hypothetical protein EDB87DRAFT_1824428 [Lactarius vividus]
MGACCHGVLRLSRHTSAARTFYPGAKVEYDVLVEGVPPLGDFIQEAGTSVVATGRVNIDRDRSDRYNPALAPGARGVECMGGGAWGLGGATAAWGRDGARLLYRTVGAHRFDFNPQGMLRAEGNRSLVIPTRNFSFGSNVVSIIKGALRERAKGEEVEGWGKASTAICRNGFRSARGVQLDRMEGKLRWLFLITSYITRSDTLTAPGKSCGQEYGSNIPAMILYAERSVGRAGAGLRVSGIKCPNGGGEAEEA